MKKPNPKRRVIFGSHRQAGRSKRKRDELRRDAPTTPHPVKRIPYDTAIAEALLSASMPGNWPKLLAGPKHGNPMRGVVLHTERIPTKDSWVVLDADNISNVLGTYSTGKAANRASAYFARFGHSTLVRRVY